MRVISGLAKATKLETLDTMDTRPTLDRVKEALFNILQSEIFDSVILDLFAGSGALGIESLSRGAKKAIFCDKSKYAIDIIRKNLIKTKLESKSIVFNTGFDECLDLLKEKINIVFLDPPYNTTLAEEAILKILNKNLLSNNAIIIVETNDENKIITGVVNTEIQVYDIRKYGNAKLVFLKRKEQL
ncbi:MAG: 16S rRNA (guanine(966)-N(2))-methyltransferase RsmD [Clostridia bacterium]|nr:16S rRNA (guanine(966)-N(2))-methyltransferase RsmD [Clostridia bacterium]